MQNEGNLRNTFLDNEFLGCITYKFSRSEYILLFTRTVTSCLIGYFEMCLPMHLLFFAEDSVSKDTYNTFYSSTDL